MTEDGKKLSIGEVCETLGMSRNAVEFRVETGRLHATVRDGEMLFDPDEVRGYARYQFIKKNRWKVVSVGLAIAAALAVAFHFGVRFREGQNYDIYKTRAAEAMSKKRYSDAVAFYKQILRVRPDDSSSRIAVAAAYRNLGMKEEMLKEYLEALKYDPRNMEILQDLAVTYLETGDLKNAKNTASRILKDNPDHLFANYIMGSVNARTKNFPAAVEYFKKVLSLRPGFAPAIKDLADVYSITQRREEAAELYEGNLAQASDVRTRLNLAITLDKQGDTQRASALYQSIIDDTPVLARAYNNLAWHLIETEKPEEPQLRQAFDLVKMALILNPKDAAALDTLGWIYFLRDMREEAEKTLREAAALDPQSAVTAFHLGRALLARGKKEEALKEFRRAKSLRPDSKTLTPTILDVYIKQLK